MKLDLNNSGSWKTVIDFQEYNLAVVRASARSMVKASDPGRLSFRIRDNEGNVIAYLDKADCEWRSK